MIGIYGIFDVVTDECLYVGQSIDIEYRVKRHRWRLLNESHLKSFSAWFNSIEKDINRLEFRVLELCTDDDPTKNALEMVWFNTLSPRFYGKVPSEKERWALSDQTKEKIAKSMCSYWDTKEGRESRLQSRVLTCGQCESEYSSGRRDSRFCSDRCSRKNRVCQVDIELITDMYLSGHTLRDIAKSVGISHVSIRSKLIDSGVVLRSPGERVDISIRV